MSSRAARTPAGWLTVEQIAAELQVSSETVYGWLRSGALRSTRYGRQYRVRSDWFAEWCEMQPSGSAGEAEPRPVVRSAPAPRLVTGGRVKRLVDLSAIVGAKKSRSAGLNTGRPCDGFPG